MSFHKTLGRYLAGTYFWNTLWLLLALLAVIYVFDTVELIRRASKYDNVPLSLVLQMGLLKLPEVGQILLPFAILFGAMFTFWQLTRRYELIVIRSSGFSVWQFLAPVLAVAVCLGFLHMLIVNPLGSLLITRFEQLENVYLKRQENQIALFRDGLWLRQKSEDGYFILYSEKLRQPDWTLSKVMVVFFDEADSYIRRLDAPRAFLEEGRWRFEEPVLYEKNNDSMRLDSYVLPTQLTRMDVEESFSSPQTMSFWRLPTHIQTMNETGFDSSRLRVHYQNLLTQPLLFAAMVLLAASVSMRPPRSRGGLLMIAFGVFIGFVVFFFSSFLQALGASQQIPVFLAAWTPPVVAFLLGLSVMMYSEDG